EHPREPRHHKVFIEKKLAATVYTAGIDQIHIRVQLAPNLRSDFVFFEVHTDPASEFLEVIILERGRISSSVHNEFETFTRNCQFRVKGAVHCVSIARILRVITGVEPFHRHADALLGVWLHEKPGEKSCYHVDRALVQIWSRGADGDVISERLIVQNDRNIL